MAESNNRPGRTEKRQLRAERKAAQLAQEQALAEKLEHERRQQTSGDAATQGAGAQTRPLRA